MSYVGPDFDAPEPRRPRRGPLMIAAAALVPAALLGWLVYEAVADSGGTPASATPRTGPSSAADSPADDGKLTGSPAAAGAASLKGKVVLVDPGHNPGNFRHTTEINRKVDIGTNRKECDTTGTSTNSGYTEAQFTLDVARRLRTILEQQGATVKFTQDGDRAWGPCVDERAHIGNAAHADAAISIHADGAAQGDRGFHVILPASVHQGSADTRPIVGPSRALGTRIRDGFNHVTGSPLSNYLGKGTGLVVRSDLGGLNLSTVPKVFIECGNMRDSKDAALLTSGAWRQKAAQGISEGIVSFLQG
ncbi:N-acetylmuramoyl-L-alanine amidase [Streptomyces sp. NPDC002573]|uniref:N-acetylmuramoyl-L-alanine amidase n=1 Tax=Streptomyces sp. NPDC002573 TaxID=3364651 RepID=UPI0036B6539A